MSSKNNTMTISQHPKIQDSEPQCKKTQDFLPRCPNPKRVVPQCSYIHVQDARYNMPKRCIFLYIKRKNTYQ